MTYKQALKAKRMNEAITGRKHRIVKSNECTLKNLMDGGNGYTGKIIYCIQLCN